MRRAYGLSHPALANPLCDAPAALPAARSPRGLGPKPQPYALSLGHPTPGGATTPVLYPPPPGDKHSLAAANLFRATPPGLGSRSPAPSLAAAHNGCTGRCWRPISGKTHWSRIMRHHRRRAAYASSIAHSRRRATPIARASFCRGVRCTKMGRRAWAFFTKRRGAWGLSLTPALSRRERGK